MALIQLIQGIGEDCSKRSSTMEDELRLNLSID
jgi:hypothetical protein